MQNNHYLASLADHKFRPPGEGERNAWSILKPNLPQISRKNIDLINSWYRRRAPLITGNASLTINLLAKSQGVQLYRVTAVTYRFFTARAEFFVSFPEDLEKTVLKASGVTSEFLTEETAFVVFLDWLSSFLDLFEGAAGGAITEIARFQGPAAEAVKGVVLEAAAVIENRNFPIEIVVPERSSPQLQDLLGDAVNLKDGWSTLPVGGTFYVGWADLSLRLVRSIRPNDVILMDASPAKSDVLVVFGGNYAAHARLDKHRLTLLERPSKREVAQAGAMTMINTEQLANGLEAQDAELDDIQIKLVFDIGHRELTIGELKTLEAGYIFDLARDPRTAVNIYAGARRVGHGELVQINQSIGVRVTRLFSHE